MYMMYYSIPGYILYMCACCAIHHLQGRGGGGGGLLVSRRRLRDSALLQLKDKNKIYTGKIECCIVC